MIVWRPGVASSTSEWISCGLPKAANGFTGPRVLEARPEAGEGPDLARR